jgi:hypothetical protein
MADDALPERAASDTAARDALRASHEDRDDVVEQLRVAGGDGRLSAEELDERVGAALVARTYGELSSLIVDLPASPAGPLAAADDVVRIECSSGSAHRVGVWTVPQRMELLIHNGNVKLDFTEATMKWPALRIDVDIRGGNLTLVTNAGIVVESGDVVIRHGNVKVKTPPSSGTPVFRVQLAGTVKTGNINARPARRPFWSRLSRAQRTPALPLGRSQ